MKHKKSFVLGTVALISGLGAIAATIYAVKVVSDLLEEIDFSVDEENEF